jgi:hypothetical protein
VLRPPGKPGGLFSGACGVVNAGSTGVTLDRRSTRAQL